MGNTADRECCTGNEDSFNDEQQPTAFTSPTEVMEEGEVAACQIHRPKKSLLTVTDPGSSLSQLSGQAGREGSVGGQPYRGSTDLFNSLDSETVHYGDGSSYCGQTVDGQRHGEGIYKCGTEQYEGQWLYDKQHGLGRQTWSDGRSYHGEYECGRFAGKGRMIWQTPKGVMVYEGEYIDDVKHGAGKFSWPDGRSYDGEWHRGKRHGRGTYKTARGEQKVGQWTGDRFVRWEVAELDEDNVNLMVR